MKRMLLIISCLISMEMVVFGANPLTDSEQKNASKDSLQQNTTADTVYQAPHLSLAQCIQMAENANATIKNAALDIAAARHQKSEALSEYFPKISLTAYGFYSIDPMIDIDLGDILGHSDVANNIRGYLENIAGLYGIEAGYTTLDYGYGAAATIMQPLYAGGRIVNGNRLASIGIQAAELKNSMAQNEQKEAIEDKYWRVVSLEEKQVTLKHALTYVTAIEKTVQSASKAGMALPSDLLQVQKEKNNLLTTQTRLESGIRIAKMDLFNSIGQSYSLFESVADADFPAIDSIQLTDRIDSLVSPIAYYIDEYQAAGNTNEAQLLDLSVKAAELEKKMAVGEALPALGVGFGYGYGKIFGDPTWNGTAFATLNIPITQWWSKSEKAARYQINVEKAENNREYLRQQLIVKVHMLWEEMNCSYKEMKLAEDTKQLSLITYQRTQSEYKAGQVTMTDLLGATTELQKAEDAYIDAKIKYKTALIKYQNFARGGQTSTANPTSSH